jgi:hypothetical protein
MLRELFGVIAYTVPVGLLLDEFVKQVAERQFDVKAVSCDGE